MHSLYDNAAALPATPAVPLQNLPGTKGLNSLNEVVSGSSEVDGVAIDSQDYVTIMAFFSLGALGGAPDSLSLAVKVQTSPDGSSGWVDLVPVAATLTQADAGFVTALRVTDANPQAGPDGRIPQRFFRAVVTPTFVGGTSPSVPVDAFFVGSRYTFDPVNP